MSDMIEGIGGAIEGSLTARAVEPQRGEGSKETVGQPESAADACLNCGASTLGNFCSQCGQKTHIHRTLWAIGHDLMHGVLHLDGKLWRTLPLLAFKPGQLTRRYIDGERARFVSPMAMFLFSVFAMFAVFQMIGLSTPTSFDFGDPVETVRAQGISRAERLQSEIEALPENDARREELQEELSFIEGILESGEIGAADTASEEALDGTPSVDLNVEDFGVNLTGIKSLDDGILKKWRENPGLMLYKLQANGYKFSWLLIPLSVPFVWLIFAWRRRFKAYDHAVFVTYSLGFMSLLFITMSLVGISPLGPGWAMAIFAIAAPLHVYKQLRHTYALRRFSAIWRFVALFFFISIVLVLFLQVLLLIGAF